jgi:hypothetical protein
MNLDPALQFHKHGVYKGFLWPNEGSNTQFLCYPPLIEWFHIASLYVLPFDIFWLRLPFLLLHVGSLYLLYRIASKLSKGQDWMALLIVSIFMFDKVVFEISRSMRVEVLLTFLLVLLVWLNIHKKHIIAQGLVAGLLFLAHLSMWPWLGIWALLRFRDMRNLLLFVLAAALPILLFFVAIDFNLGNLYQQLFQQAEQHAGSGSLFQNSIDFIWNRFWPVYKEQPWALLFTPFLLLAAIVSLLKKRHNPYAWCFLATSIAWILILAPHYRYWPPLFAAGLIMLAYELKDSTRPVVPARAVGLGVLVALSLGFWARHALAFSQRASRNPDSALSWLDTQLQPEVKTLIVGEGIAFYTTQNPNFDYGITFYPQQLHFQSYAKVYCLTRDSLPYTLLSRYKVKDNTTLPQLRQWQRGETYAGMKLYLIKTKSEWDSLTGKYQQYRY